MGRIFTEGGAIVVCGGREGVMAAACRGARLAGGLTAGILPGMVGCQLPPSTLTAPSRLPDALWLWPEGFGVLTR